MNREIGKIGAWIVTLTVALFAVFMVVWTLGSFIVCLILPLGYIMLVAALAHECQEDRKVAANVGLSFAAIYAVLVMLVYFAQTTSVRFDTLDESAMLLLDYSKGSLAFSYDLLGYGMMALSTFFVGLSFNAKDKADKWLKALLMIHGIFFFTCLIMPMTGAFSSMTSADNSISGVIVLEFWCAYFLPIGILSIRHFTTTHIGGFS